MACLTRGDCGPTRTTPSSERYHRRRSLTTPDAPPVAERSGATASSLVESRPGPTSDATFLLDAHGVLDPTSEDGSVRAFGLFAIAGALLLVGQVVLNLQFFPVALTAWCFLMAVISGLVRGPATIRLAALFLLLS